MVVFSHFPVPGLSGAALTLNRAGYAGVTLFFVLSGFVIAYNYLERFEAGMSPRSVGDYFAARLARVYPLYFFFIFFGWVAQGLPSPPWAHILAIQTWSADAKLAFSVNAAAWSVGVEVFLYLAFPLLIPVFVRLGVFSSLRRLQVAAALVSLAMLYAALYFTLSGQNALPVEDPASGHRWLYRNPATRLGDFLLGIFGAVYFMRFAKTDRATVRRWGFVTVLAAMLMLVLLASKPMYRSAFSWDVAYALPALLVIVGLAMNGETLISRVLASPALVLLGEASYALYLLHLPAAPLRHRTDGGLPYEIVLYAIYLVMMIALSIGLHIAIEKPARRWIRSRLSPRATRVAVPHQAAPGEANGVRPGGQGPRSPELFQRDPGQ